MTIDNALLELQKMIQFWENRCFEIKRLNPSQFYTGKAEGIEEVIENVKLIRLRLMRKAHEEEKEESRKNKGTKKG